MIIILSPSKTLRKEQIPHPAPTLPLFPEKTGKLMRKLQRMSRPQIKKLMGTSDDLTNLNFERFQGFDPDFTKALGEPAIYAYQGDAYIGLDSPSWSDKDLEYAQPRLLILSGLYGIVHPSTLIQPYRLEMGGRFKIGRDSNLYTFWKTTLSEHLRTYFQDQNEEILVNLASREYSDVLDQKKIGATTIEIHFREWRKDKWQFISYDSKKARGTMARYIIQNRIEKVEHLRKFDLDGYRFNEELSTSGVLFYTK